MATYRYKIVPENSYGQPVGPSETVSSEEEIPEAKKRLRLKHFIGVRGVTFHVFKEEGVATKSREKKKREPAKKPAFKSTGRNIYSVTPVNSHGHADLPSKKVDGYAEISPAKAHFREKLDVKRHKFDVYNESKKKFV